MAIHSQLSKFKCTLLSSIEPDEIINCVEVVAKCKREALNKLKNRFYPNNDMYWDVELIHRIPLTEIGLMGEFDEEFTTIKIIK